jgi:hypothetical protein
MLVVEVVVMALSFSPHWPWLSAKSGYCATTDRNAGDQLLLRRVAPSQVRRSSDMPPSAARARLSNSRANAFIRSNAWELPMRDTLRAGFGQAAEPGANAL